MSRSGTVSDLFARNIGTFTSLQQDRLQQSTVTVTGCGGLGGYVIEELSRLGIGFLNICDPDFFSSSNINRQRFAAKNTIGVNKAIATAKGVNALHDKTTVVAVPTNFQENTDKLFTHVDVVADCLDNTASRLELGRLCHQKELPLVHGAVSGWYGQAGIQWEGNNLIKGLYTAPSQTNEKEVSVIACTVALVASIQVAEICKLLLDIASPLRDNWMTIDLKNMTFDLVSSS